VRRTLFVLAIVVPAGALIGLLLDSGSQMFGSSPSLARKTGNQSASEAASRPQALSLSDGSGSELFLERTAEAPIGAATVTYARTYAAAASYTSAGTGVLVATDPVMIFNPAPRSEHDVARLLTIGTANGSQAARRALEAAFGSRTGIRGREARIEGEADLSRISRVRFLGSVEAAMVDPEVPDGTLTLATERLVIDFDGREIVSISTDVAFTLTRKSGDLTLTGRGLDLDLRDDRARLHHDVRVNGALPGRLPSDAPFTLAAPGPVELAFGKRDPAKRGSFALAGTRATGSGGVAFQQGDLEGSARDATVAFGPTAAVERVELSGDVRLANAEGEARGSKLVVTPPPSRRGPVESRGDGHDLFAKLEGSPITIRPRRGAALLPAQLGDDPTITTTGALTISTVYAGALGRGRRIGIAQPLAVDGSRGHLAAKSGFAWVSAEPTPRIPYHVGLRDVDAHDDETTIKASDAAIGREGIGAEVVDRITLTGKYDMLHRPKPAPGARGASQAPESSESRAVPSFAKGPLRVRCDANGTFDVKIPVSWDRPLVIDVQQGFRAEALDSAGGKAPPRATLEADVAHLELESDGLAAPNATGPRRAPTKFSATGRVKAEIPERAKASGNQLFWDARTRQVVLVGGTQAGQLARVERTEKGSKDWVRAVTFTFNQDLLQLVATQQVDGELALQPLPWVGIPPPPRGTTVPSAVKANRLVANLDAARWQKGEVAASEVKAEINVRVTQPERVLTGDLVSFDTVRRSGTARGAPLRYTVMRLVDGKALGEGIACPSITIDGRRIVIEGPAEGIFHARRGLGIPDKNESGSRPAAVPLEPVNLKLARRGVILEDEIVAEGRVTLAQGEGQATTTASGDSAIVFLVRESGAETRSSHRDLGLLVLTGNAKYVSAEMDAAADVMKVNRLTRHASLFNERPAKVTLIMKRQVHSADVVNGVSKLDIDFTDPNNPAGTARKHDLEVVPASRTGQQ
jgi:hypothetical protein